MLLDGRGLMRNALPRRYEMRRALCPKTLLPSGVDVVNWNIGRGGPERRASQMCSGCNAEQTQRF